MFYSTLVPGILHAEVLAILSSREGHQGKKAAAGMTVGKSIEPSTDEFTLIRLYEQFRRPIHSYTYRLLGNQEDADDVTQEVFVRACTSWDGLYERQHLSSWLYRIATNLCVDMLRRRKRASWWPLAQHFRQGDDRFTETTGSEDFIAFLSDHGGIPEVAERELIRQTLQSLPTDYAITLVLSAAQGLSYQEVAAVVGISPNAAATRISRAKKLFADHYQRLCKDDVALERKRR
ncbi:MAG: RNA polymerase sigma factor [Ktedonobacteraceae bacterium]|nr:RNA polymerase sigma factor [Ktedonobacteraceae bacterium]MBO0795553.1 RNA polymerase sigma factor [Ktedonobacteraceae bacterium]